MGGLEQLYFTRPADRAGRATTTLKLTNQKQPLPRQKLYLEVSVMKLLSQSCGVVQTFTYLENIAPQSERHDFLSKSSENSVIRY